MKPINRHEVFLEALAKGEACGLEPATREEMFIKQIAQRESASVGAPDWNQSDPSAPGYVKNRPMYTEPSYEVVFEVDVDSYNFAEPSDVGIELGALYKVSLYDKNFSLYDIVTMNALHVSIPSIGANMYYIGSNPVGGAGSSEYGITIYTNLNSSSKDIHVVIDTEIWNLDDISALGLLRACEEVHALDPKFIPKVAAIADLTEPPTANDFNNLLANLRAAGYMEE